MEEQKDSEMLTTTDVARLLHLHDNTVRRLANEGLLQAYRLGPRGDRRFTRSAIREYLQQGVIRPRPRDEADLSKVA